MYFCALLDLMFSVGENLGKNYSAFAIVSGIDWGVPFDTDIVLDKDDGMLPLA